MEAAQWAMVRGWLDRGVDGFRLDVFNAFLKDPELRDNPTKPGRTAWDRQVHINDRDQPDLPDLIGRFRAIVDEQPGRMSVGELFDGTAATAAGLTVDRHIVFDWELIGRALDGDRRSPTAMADREAAFGPERLADGHAVEPRPVASVPRRLAEPIGADPRRRRPRRRGHPADDARDAVPVLRRGDRDARRRHPD